jgi:hypothetical protein
MTPILSVILQSATQISNTPSWQFGPFRISREIKVDNISLVIALATLLFAIYKEIQTRKQVRAEAVRGAAAKTLSKLQRWRELALWFYTDVQPLFVSTSEMLLTDFNVQKARDYLWSNLANVRIKSADRIIDECLEGAYVELSSYYPDIYEVFSKTLQTMKKVDEARYSDLQEVCQADVLGVGKGERKTYVSASLGNELRGSCGAVRHLFEQQLTTICGPIQSALVQIIQMQDNQLANAKKRTIQINSPKNGDYPNLFEYFSRTHDLKKRLLELRKNSAGQQALNRSLKEYKVESLDEVNDLELLKQILQRAETAQAAGNN